MPAIFRTLELIFIIKEVKVVLLPFILQFNNTNLAPLVISVWLTPVNPQLDLWVFALNLDKSSRLNFNLENCP